MSCFLCLDDSKIITFSATIIPLTQALIAQVWRTISVDEIKEEKKALLMNKGWNIQFNYKSIWYSSKQQKVIDLLFYLWLSKASSYVSSMYLEILWS